jgi:hypothetical protein
MDPNGRSSTQAGYICGIIGTILGGLYLLACFAYLAFIGVFIATTSRSSSPGPSAAPVNSQPMQIIPPPPPAQLR